MRLYEEKGDEAASQILDMNPPRVLDEIKRGSISFTKLIETAEAKPENMIGLQIADEESIYNLRVQKIDFNDEEERLIYLQDVTSIHKINELETHERLTSMYSANVSHEMRTPISTSINFTDLLLQREKDPTKRKHLEIIKFSCVLMLNNVNDTLDHAQITKGTFQTKLMKCEVREVI